VSDGSDTEASSHSRERSGWRSLLVDPTPLRRHPQFRRLFAARVVSFVGSMITFVALPAQVYAITGSSLAVGLMGLAEAVPLVGAALIGGALADRIDRRRQLVVCEFGMVVATGLLALNGARGEHASLWVAYVFAAVAAAFDGFERPAIEALNQQLVDPDEIASSNGLNATLFSFGMILGPAIGGVIVDSFGFGWAFGVDAATFLVGGVLALSLHPRRAARDSASIPESPFADVREGWEYARSRRDLLGSYLVDINAMVFGMPIALFPALAVDLGGTGTLGLLYAAPAVGSLIAGMFSGIVRLSPRHGVGLLWAASGWGIAIVAFGLIENRWIALGFLAVAGATDMISGLYRMAIWNQSIPNQMRGRLAGIEMLSYSLGPTLGNVESGFVAAATTVRTSVVSGGILCVVVGGVLAIALPALRNYRAPDAPGDRSGGDAGS
jgi:MFS family permease